MKTNAVIFTLAMLLVCPQIATADDFAQPWYRGLPLSYYAEWEFTNGPLPTIGIPPELESDGGPKNNEFLYDLFGTHIDLDGGGWTWDPADGDGGMVNPGRPGSFGINTINWVDEEPLKYIRVQITHIGPAPIVVGASGYKYDPYHDPGNPPITSDLGAFPAGPSIVVDANHFYSDILMWPNPDWEQIVVDVPMGTIIDEIIVDTISIPEPASVGLLLIALAAMGTVRKV
jgi:hypothetical protein